MYFIINYIARILAFLITVLDTQHADSNIIRLFIISVPHIMNYRSFKTRDLVVRQHVPCIVFLLGQIPNDN